MGPGGELPLDLQSVLKHPAVMWLLMPKAKQGQAASASGNMPDVPNAPKGTKRKRKSKGKKQQAESEVTEPTAKKSRVPMPISS